MIKQISHQPIFKFCRKNNLNREHPRLIGFECSFKKDRENIDETICHSGDCPFKDVVNQWLTKDEK